MPRTVGRSLVGAEKESRRAGCRVGNTGRLHVYLIKPDGTGEEQLTNGDGGADGREILVVVGKSHGTSQIAVLSPSGATPAEITHAPCSKSDPDW